MAEFPSKVSTRTSSPAQGAGASVSALRPDLGFVRSSLGALMLLQLVSARGAAGSGWGLRGREGSGLPPLLPVLPHLRLRRAATRLSPGRLQDARPGDHPQPSHLETSLLRSPRAPVFTVPTRAHPIVPRGGHWRPAKGALTDAQSLRPVRCLPASLSQSLSLSAREMPPALQDTQPE